MADTFTVQELTNLRLGTLKTAIGDWETMSNRLEKLSTGGDGRLNANDLRKKANEADWQGVNATVSRKFVTKTATQFSDAASEAKSVLGVLRGVHSDFTSHKNKLSTAIEELSKRNIYVNDNGTCIDASPHGRAAGDGKDIIRPSKEELDSAETRIKKILSEAAETDRIAARALRKVAKDKYDFTDSGSNSLEEADERQGEADAKYWEREIAKGHVNEWSKEKLARFNEMLRNQKDNPGFTVNFATGLGADGTLQFWRDLAAPAGGAVEGDKAKMLGHVQDNLSMALANATHDHSDRMEHWKKDVIAAGTKPFPVDPRMVAGPNGFQVMSSLMHKGNFDSEFLDSYGRSMLKYERTFPHGADPELIWRDNTNLEYPPSGNSNDPVTGFMDALGHNPQESLKFFSESTGDGADRMNNFDYLAGHDGASRDWPDGENGKPLGYKNLGHALESATLGYAYDDKTPHIPPMNTPEQIKAHEDRLDLFGRVMNNYNTTDSIEKQPGIGESLGKMAAGNIDSLNYSITNWGGTGDAIDRDGLYHARANHLRDFGEGGVEAFLSAVASDKESYEIVSSAQQTYNSSLMASQDDYADARRAGLHSMGMHGLLDAARAESIGREFADQEDARNKALEKQGEWRKFVAGAAIGVGVGVASEVVLPAGAAAAVAVPLGFETLGKGGETVAGTNTIDWLHESEYSNDDEAIKTVRDAKIAAQHRSMVPVLNWAGEQNLAPEKADDLAFDAETYYNNGAKKVDTSDIRGWN